MAIKIQGTTVIDDSRNATALTELSFDSITLNGTTVVANADELNRLQGVTDPIDSQLGALAKDRGTLNKTFTSGETAAISLTSAFPSDEVPVLSVTKEVPQTGLTNNDWDVASDGTNYTLHDTAYDTTLTPSNATDNGTFTLGTGSFATEDVGKRIVGNGGEAILTAADGSYELQSDFVDTSTIAAGDWSMFALDVESADAGLALAGIVKTYFLENNQNPDSTTNQLNTSNAFVNATVKPDGTKIFVGQRGAVIAQFSITTPWDMSTLSLDHEIDLRAILSEANLEIDGIDFKDDGSRMFISTNQQTTLQFDLSSPWDISNPSFNPSDSFDWNSYANSIYGFVFKPDGTKMIGVDNNDNIHEYVLGTAWDITSIASSTPQNTFNISPFLLSGGVEDIVINDDGTSAIVSLQGYEIHRFVMSNPWDVSSMSFLDAVQISGNSNLMGTFFKTGGDKFFVANEFQKEVHTYDSSLIFLPTSANHTAITSTSTDTEFWTDINSMTADDESNDGSVYYAVSTDNRTTWSIIDDTDGVRNIVRDNAGTWEYNSNTTYGSETWTAATENDEFYALEEAATLTVNRMDATQLNAVSDANHYTLGNDLDLAITLTMPDGNTNSPTSDGVVINYDANALNQSAIPGTDYDYDFPSNDTVRFTALSNENFKIRVA